MSVYTKAELEKRLKDIAHLLDCDTMDEIEGSIHYLQVQQHHLRSKSGTLSAIAHMLEVDELHTDLELFSKEIMQALTRMLMKADQVAEMEQMMRERLAELSESEQREMAYETAIDVILSRISAGIRI